VGSDVTGNTLLSEGIKLTETVCRLSLYIHLLFAGGWVGGNWTCVTKCTTAK